jgi:hypothetical protein
VRVGIGVKEISCFALPSRFFGSSGSRSRGLSSSLSYRRDKSRYSDDIRDGRSFLLIAYMRTVDCAENVYSIAVITAVSTITVVSTVTKTLNS